MIYFIYGNQSPTIKSKIKKITSSFLETSVDEFNFVTLDGFNVTVQEAIDECKYTSLGFDKKVVSLENCYFLLKSKPRNKLESEQNYDELLDYIENDTDDSVAFILSISNSSIDEKNKIVSLLKQKANVIQIEDPDEKNFSEYIKTFCDKNNIVIDKDALVELANRCNEDVALFRNNIDKLSLYSEHITYKDVVKMVTRQLEDEAFLLSNYLLDGDNMAAVSLFKDLKANNVEPVTLITQLSNQLRLVNEVRYLLRTQRMMPDQAAKELGIKTGRIFVISKKLAFCSEQMINDALDNLFKLDYEIKSGQVDRYYAFELFLINFKRN